MLSNFPALLNDEDDLSYNVEFLFTNIPIKDTIEYIIEQIYTHKKLKHFCSKLIFKSLLLKLATECTYTFNHTFCKQIDGCTMGDPFSVTFSNIYMITMDSETSVIKDIYNRRKKIKNEELLKKLNNYHAKIELTIEVSPIKFLDLSLHLKNGIYDFNVHRDSAKKATH